jgi:hypothetical protein
LYFWGVIQIVARLNNIRKNKIINGFMDKAVKTLDKETSDKVSFITFIIPAFAEAYKMNIQDAYRYLKKYGGIDFLSEHWWALHTDNVLYALDDIYTICNQNGGQQ